MCGYWEGEQIVQVVHNYFTVVILGDEAKKKELMAQVKLTHKEIWVKSK